MNQSKHYEVEWTDSASTDMEYIIDYIADDDPLAAVRILKKIRKKAESLYSLPDRGRVVPELKSQGITTYREIIHYPWRIIYRVGMKKVYVVAVLDGRRNIEDLLLERFYRPSTE